MTERYGSLRRDLGREELVPDGLVLQQSTVKNAQAAVRKRLFVAKKDW
jgi:hypothetical protein